MIHNEPNNLLPPFSIEQDFQWDSSVVSFAEKEIFFETWTIDDEGDTEILILNLRTSEREREAHYECPREDVSDHGQG